METKIVQSLQDLGSRMTAFLPALVTGLIVLGIGLLVAWLTARVLVRILVLLRLDRVVGRLGGPKTFALGDVRHSFFNFIGGIAGGLVFLIFLDKAILIWELPLLSRILENFLTSIPDLVVALIILLAGWGAGSAIYVGLRRMLYREQVPKADLIARFVRGAILLFAMALALIRLNLAVTLVTWSFLIVLGAMGGTCLLAFGLGSRRAIEKMWEDRRPRQADPAPPEEPARTDS
jgi:hypothetical protein